jgi:hypothetical protein
MQSREMYLLWKCNIISVGDLVVWGWGWGFGECPFIALDRTDEISQMDRSVSYTFELTHRRRSYVAYLLHNNN